MIDISIGSLELQRTNPSHLGTAPLSDKFAKGIVSTEEPGRAKGAFESYLLEAMESLNGNQVAVDKIPKFLKKYKGNMKLITLKESGFAVKTSSLIQENMLSNILDVIQDIDENLLVKEDNPKDTK